MNSRRSFARMSRDMDALTLEVRSEGAAWLMRAFLRLLSWWWAVRRWWLYDVAWTRPIVAISRRKRRAVAVHAEHGLQPPYVRAAFDRAAWQCIRFDLERRVRESDRPERWDGDRERVAA